MSSKPRIIVVGTGGLAREFAVWFGDVVEIIGFSVDLPDQGPAAQLPGARFDNHVKPAGAGTDQCVVAVADPKMKRHLHQLLSDNGWRFPTLVHQSALVAQNAVLSEGVIVSPRTVIGSNAVIGALSYLNFQVGIGHDAVLGRYVQVNPGAQIGGETRIGDAVLLGSNSSLLQRVAVGDGTTVGIGAVCLSRVRAGETVVGNPAKKWFG